LNGLTWLLHCPIHCSGWSVMVWLDCSLWADRSTVLVGPDGLTCLLSCPMGWQIYSSGWSSMAWLDCFVWACGWHFCWTWLLKNETLQHTNHFSWWYTITWNKSYNHVNYSNDWNLKFNHQVHIHGGFIKRQALDKLTGCERDLAINLPDCFGLLFLLSFIRKTKNARL